MTRFASILILTVSTLCSAWALTPVTSCGTTLSIPGEHYILPANLNCAVAPGVQIGADKIVLDLNGHTLRGPGFGAGVITAIGPSCAPVGGVHITGGMITGFSTAVSICAPYSTGGQTMNTLIDHLTLTGNVDGVRIYYSNGNRVLLNSIQINRGVGIRLYSSHYNQIGSNILSRNASAAYFSGGIQLRTSNNNQIISNRLESQGMFGILLEDSDSNLLGSNAITGTQLSGTPAVGIILIGPDSRNNTLRSNTSNGNQDGISLGCSGGPSGCNFVSPEVGGALSNVLIGNTANNNKRFGIDLSDNTAQNRVETNIAAGNGVFDGHDDQGQFPCGTNLWLGNTFGTVNQPCVH